MKNNKGYSRQELYNDLQRNIGDLKKELEDTFKDKNYIKEESEKIVYIILDECLDISESVHIDIYMYYFSMENYHHPCLFLGHYYIDYSCTKISMIWERVINVLSMLYDVKYAEKDINNNMKKLYKELIKKEKFDKKIKDLLTEAMKSNNFGEIKKHRNTNEHDLTAHLKKNIDIRKLGEDYNYICDEQGLPYLNDDIYRKILDDTNYIARENKESIVYKIKYQLEIFRLVYKEILNKINVEFKDKTVIVQNRNFYTYNYDKEVNIYVEELLKNRTNLVEYISKSYARALIIRESIVERTDLINKNPILAWQKPPTNQILEYHVDAIFRLVECIRSVIIELQIINKLPMGIIDAGLTDFYYYHDYVLLRLYSCFEKIGKLLYVRYELDKYEGNKKDLKNTYLERIIVLAKKEKLNKLEPIVCLKKIIDSQEYRLYKKIRNKSYHGIKPNHILEGEKAGNFELVNIFISCKLIEKLLDLLEIFEEGEKNFLNMTIATKKFLFKKDGIFLDSFK